jgi:hypothetical protein
MNYNTYNAVGGGIQRRVRQPHPHDVLSGRGGGINSHVGNIQFRAWVADRKNDYNLATSKAEKTQVAQTVIDLVEAQDPPGRFLQRDPTGSGSGMNGFWLELDEDRRMAKTAQALREGAPQIRAQHKDEIEKKKSLHKRSSRKASESQRKGGSNSKRFYPESTSVQQPALPQPQVSKSSRNWIQQRAMEELQRNVERAKREKEMGESHESDEEWPPEASPSKRLRIDHHPCQTAQHPKSLSHNENQWPLSINVPPPLPEPKAPRRSSSSSGNAKKLGRAHSLALSDMSGNDWATEDFVNPFASDSDLRIARADSDSISFPRPDVMRDDSGDLDWGALFRSNSSNNGHNSNGSNSKLQSSSPPHRSSFSNLSKVDNGNLSWGWNDTDAAPVSP